MLFTTMGIMAIGIALPFTAVGRYLGFVALPASFFLWLLLFVVTYGVLTHIVKTWFYRRFGTD